MEPCDLQPWDTDFFGCRVARVRGDILTEPLAKDIDDWSIANRIQALYFLSRADHPGTMRIAERHEFELMDLRVTLERELTGQDAFTLSKTPHLFSVRQAVEADIPALSLIARAVHTDTRFFKDSRFSTDRAEELYATWINSDVKGRAQRVLAAVLPAGEPVGYITCSLNSNGAGGSIGLLGVSPNARGLGIGSALVRAALGWFQSEDVQHITVVTQGSNRSALRLYQRCGFIHADLQFWYHKWFDI